MNSACSGFVYGMISGLSLYGPEGAVIVCAVEAMSRLIDKTDRNTACLFGDGTGAVLVESRSTFRGTAGTQGVTATAPYHAG